MSNPLQDRILGISGDALPTWDGEPVLVPLRLSGTEALGKLYEYAVDMATVDKPTLGLWKAQELVGPDNLIGKIVTVSIEFEGKGTFTAGMVGDSSAGNVGAGTRTISGLVTDVEITGSDDRQAYYRFIVRPVREKNAIAWASLILGEPMCHAVNTIRVISLAAREFCRVMA
jgi:type VI secretion system secreted protein VgrG